MKLNKDSSLIYKKIQYIFKIYRDCIFNIENKQLLVGAGFLNEQEKNEWIEKFVAVVDIAIKKLNDDEQKVIKLSFIDEVHYSKSYYSRTCFFAKRKMACEKLYNMLFLKIKHDENVKIFFLN